MLAACVLATLAAPAVALTVSTQAALSSAVVEWGALPRRAPPASLPSPAARRVPDRPVPAGPSEAPRRPLPAAVPLAARPAATTLATGFDGLGDPGPVVVPDVMGAAGATRLFETLNTQVAVLDRAGVMLDSVSLQDFWASVATAPFDPRLVFDESSRRFVFVALEQQKSTASAVLVGVSAADDPAGAWRLDAFPADSSGKDWADAPAVGINGSWIAVTVNMFAVSGDAFDGAKMYVFDKAAAVSTGPTACTVLPTGFDAVGPGGGNSLQGALTYGDEPSLYFVDDGWLGSGGQRYVRVSRLAGTPAAPSWSLVGGLVPVAAFGAVAAAPQAGTARTVDARDTRVTGAVYRDGSLWLAHTGGLPAAAPARDAVLWAQLDPAAPALLQEGAVDGGGQGMSYFDPSLAVDGLGDVLLGFAGSSPSTFLSAYAAGRSGRDPPGTTQAVVELAAGQAAYYRPDADGVNRWGDTTAAVSDPMDGASFWTVEQYAAMPSGQDRWGTWWEHLTLSHDLPSSLSAARVFPVPWTPGSGDRYDSAARPGCGKGLVFEDLDGEATIRVYTILGDLVATLTVSTADAGCKAWDGRNLGGNPVASGVYLAVIRNPSGEKVVKRLVVER